ncbi:hypothetical protein N0V88_007706 [Collariella sp. IMI 366227]|nr:hypothetical protein N0V88_007706 [Collariella sp. IMI 366227]
MDSTISSIYYLCFSGIWVLPLSIIWFISLCLARRNDDPARVGVAWIKAAYPLWIFAIICFTINGGLSLWTSFIYEDSSYDYIISVYDIARPSAHISSVGVLFEYLTDVVLFVTCTELASGFLLCINGGQPPAARKTARSAMLGVGIGLVAVSIAFFGLNEAYIERVFNPNTSRRTASSLNVMANRAIRLSAAVKIMMWVASLQVMGYAAYAVHKVKRVPGLNRTSNLLLAATVLSTTRLLILMAMYIHYNITSSSLLTYDPAIGSIVEPILNHVLMFILLVLLFTLAVRKAHNGGLWSQPQQVGNWFFPGGAVQFVPTPEENGQYGQEVVQQPPVGAMQQHHHQQQHQGDGQVQQGLPAYLQVAQQQQQYQQQGQYYYPPPQGQGKF